MEVQCLCWFLQAEFPVGFRALSTVSIEHNNKIKQYDTWAPLVDTKGEEPVSQAWAGHGPVGGDTRFLPPQGCQWGDRDGW